MTIVVTYVGVTYHVTLQTTTEYIVDRSTLVIEYEIINKLSVITIRVKRSSSLGW